MPRGKREERAGPKIVEERGLRVTDLVFSFIKIFMKILF